jgi:hypothetical protein
MTPDEYDMLVMDWWTTYCYAKAENKISVQKLLTNNTLFQWWHAQLEMVEPEFVEDAWPFKDTYTKDDANKLYAKHAYKLQKYYNSDLIKEALQ